MSSLCGGGKFYARLRSAVKAGMMKSEKFSKGEKPWQKSNAHPGSGWKEALVVIALAVLLSLVRQMSTPSYDMSSIPDYDGTSAYTVIDRNQPSFTEDEYTTDSYEYYSDLDSLGRCGVTEACIGVDLMPTEERESISKVKPTGWVQNQYDFVDGKSLYSRCHLIGFQLTII